MTGPRAAAPLHEVLAGARHRLVSAGFGADEAARDVSVLARSILGWDLARLITDATAPAPAALEPTLSQLVERRAALEPLAYITGTREFWGLDLEVTPAVLIPRPETEFVVEESLAALARDAGSTTAPLLAADIGTGSGCIAVALAHELRGCRIVATDLSRPALEVARRNAQRHGVAARIDFVAAAYLDGLRGNFDLIAANPPYVRDGDRMALAADVRHEPDVALFGGSNGLRNIEGVLDAGAARLRPGGHLIMEFGFGQEADVLSLVSRRRALEVVRIREDLQGIARTAVIRRAS